MDNVLWKGIGSASIEIHEVRNIPQDIAELALLLSISSV